jgi:hypothetical protein
MQKIFLEKNGHFQQVTSQTNMFLGKPSADPFIIAHAKINQAIVVTQEKPKPMSAKIPNICEHLGIECINLQKFM